MRIFVTDPITSSSCLLFSSSSSSLAIGVKGCLSTSPVASHQQHSKARRRREDARRIRRRSGPTDRFDVVSHIEGALASSLYRRPRS